MLFKLMCKVIAAIAERELLKDWIEQSAA